MNLEYKYCLNLEEISTVSNFLAYRSISTPIMCDQRFTFHTWFIQICNLTVPTPAPKWKVTNFCQNMGLAVWQVYFESSVQFVPRRDLQVHHLPLIFFFGRPWRGVCLSRAKERGSLFGHSLSLWFTSGIINEIQKCDIYWLNAISKKWQ